MSDAVGRVPMELLVATHFGEWLKREIGKRGYSQLSFAARSGIPRPTLQEWLRHPGPRLLAENLSRLAAALDMTTEDLERELVEAGGSIGGGPRPKTGGRTVPGLVIRSLPVFRSVSAARLVDRTPEDVAHQHLPAPPDDPDAFAAVLDGDCMEPAYAAGDIVVFSPSVVRVKGVEDGHDYFVQLDGAGGGENTFKRVHLDPTDPAVFVLRPLNPAHAERRVRRDSVVRMARAIWIVKRAP